MKALIDFSEPNDDRGVRRFLGRAEFFGRYIYHFALIVEPPANLLQANQPLVWEVKKVAAFNEIKRLMSSKPILAAFNPKRGTELHTDACFKGLATILFQKDDKINYAQFMLLAVARAT